LARTDDELDRVWEELACERSDFVPPDFENEMLFVYFMGEQPTGGFWAEVSEVSIAGENARITVVEHEPGRGCPVTQAVTRPAVGAALLRTSGTIRVDVRTHVEKCE
jgi:hypothetical protein